MPAVAHETLVQMDKEAYPGAVYKTRTAQLHQTVTVVGRNPAPDGIAPDRMNVESFRNADALPCRLNNGCATRTNPLHGTGTPPRLPALRNDGRAEMPEIVCVSFEQAARLLEQAENPLQTGALHPLRRAFHAAGQKINGRTHANGHRHTQRPIVHGDPFFLLGTSKGYEQKIRFRSLNTPLNFIMVHFEQRLERRRIIPDNVQPGMLPS